MKREKVLVPHVICFYDNEEVEAIREEYTLESLQEDYPNDDFDRTNYLFIQEGTEADMGGWDAVPYRYRIVQRISDKKYFKWRDHADSWDLDWPGVGEYGNIFEVAPTTKIVYEQVKA